MTPLLALFFLGLCVGAGNLMQAGMPHRPTLWAEPGSPIPWGSPVTFWCQGIPGVEALRLRKEGSTLYWDMQFPLEPGDKARFFIAHMTDVYAGIYYCYSLSPAGWSGGSDPLELVVTGVYNKPSLSALPSPVVTSGATVTLRCASELGFNSFVLTQEGESETTRTFSSQTISSGKVQALFSVGPVMPRCKWIFRCYGYSKEKPQVWSQSSNPLQLLVSDGSVGPSLLSPQGPIVTPGQNLTLQCRSQVGYDHFALFKEGTLDYAQRPSQQPQPGLSQADFLLGPMYSTHGGRYHCVGSKGISCLWSELSDPLDILVAGHDHYTPTLSVQPGLTVSSGENVTLLCQSGGHPDTFLLAKEGTAESPLRVRADGREWWTQGRFSFHPVTSTHNGTYKCYSSRSNTPYRLSQPSDPLQLWVSGNSGVSSHPAPGPMANTDPVPPDYTVQNLIRMGMAGCLLLLLVALLFEALHSRNTRRCCWEVTTRKARPPRGTLE